MESESPSLIPCHIKIPLTYNDGTPVGQDCRDEILDQFFAEFGGYTVEGTETGAYRRMDTGKKQVEQMLRISIAVSGPTEVSRLERIVAEIGHQLGQECMYFEVSSGSTVKLLESTKKGDR